MAARCAKEWSLYDKKSPLYIAIFRLYSRDKRQKLFKSWIGFVISSGRALLLRALLEIRYWRATRETRSSLPFLLSSSLAFARIIYIAIYLIRINEGIINRAGTAPPFTARHVFLPTCKSSQLIRGSRYNAEGWETMEMHERFFAVTLGKRSQDLWH